MVSTTTETTMSSAVPPRLKEPTTLPANRTETMIGLDRHDAQEDGAREADAIDHLREVVAGRARPVGCRG